MSVNPYKNQDYESIKSECLSNQTLFTDTLFAANLRSLYKKNKSKGDNIQWRRPKDIVDNPQFIVGSITPDDFDQGQIGDCWLISAIATVAYIPDYINKVVPSGQSFDDANYSGCFHFQFWQYGNWVDVVVDDFLPVDSNGRLCFCHNNKDTNEMIGPLIEKAYAKLNGCYEFLDGGEPIDALIDMTGGVHESYSVVKTKTGDTVVEVSDFWNIIFHSLSLKSLAGAAINPGNQQIEHVQSNGLVLGHAYSLTESIEIFSDGTLRTHSSQPSQDNSIKLLRMRNPWGQSKSWNGDFSANSPKWAHVSDDIKNQINYNQQNDGEFFISFADFCKCFGSIQFVHANMNAFGYKSLGQEYNWNTQIINGAWIVGVNAGGCGNDDYDSYWLNPQFTITLALKNQVDDKVSMIVSLMQTESTRKRKEGNGSYESSFEALGFSVFSIVNDPSSKISKNKKFSERDLNEVGKIDSYMYQREVCAKFDLPPGNYVIIPSLFDKNKAMKFLLRIITEENVTASSNTQVTELNVQPRFKKSNNVQIPKDDNEERISQENENNKENNSNQENLDSETESEEPHQHNLIRMFNQPVVSKVITDGTTMIVSKACSIM